MISRYAFLIRRLKWVYRRVRGSLNIFVVCKRVLLVTPPTRAYTYIIFHLVLLKRLHIIHTRNNNTVNIYSLTKTIKKNSYSNVKEKSCVTIQRKDTRACVITILRPTNIIYTCINNIIITHMVFARNYYITQKKNINNNK